jgi:phosphoribosylanthranilate isomerase
MAFIYPLLNIHRRSAYRIWMAAGICFYLFYSRERFKIVLVNNLMHTRIKICGMTRAQDIDIAIEAGVDAIGFVFYTASPRCIALDQAARLRQSIPAFVQLVALFVNAEDDVVRHVLDMVGPDLLQFHGAEPPAECEQYRQRYLKAFRVGAPGLDSAQGLAQTCAAYQGVAGWLFDSYSDGYGGSGTTFDYTLLDKVRLNKRPPLVLAGGLNPSNVAKAVQTVRPWAVDVSSGVEDAPGLKSAQKILAFVQAVREGSHARC